MTNHSYILYTHPLSANGRKVMACVKLLSLNAEIKLVNVYQGEGQHPDYLKINPLGQIPTLVDVSANVTIRESNFILMYLAQRCDNTFYYPVEKQVDIIQWLFWEASQWQPALSTVLRESVAHRLLPSLFPPPSGPVAWNEAAITRLLNFMNSQLGERQFLVGDALTMADIAVAGMMTYFRFAKFPFDQYSHIRDWYQYIERLDAWQSSACECWSKI